MLRIDGSQGEGGGQIVRSALALAAISGQAVLLDNIRAGRAKPGLQRQHLTASLAAAELCDAEIEGAALGSRSLRFRPRGRPRGGSYHFAIGTAGSAALVLQTVVWPLLLAEGPSTVILEGGTHNDKAPPYDFLRATFLPVVRRLGGEIRSELERYGFYPKGGGRLAVHLEPCPKLSPLRLLDPGPLVRLTATALVARLPRAIAERELAVVRRHLPVDEARAEVVAAASPGNVLCLHLEREQITETITSFGRRGLPAERVASAAVKEAQRYLQAEVPVGVHLADQLIIPLALAGGGAFRTLPLSEHTKTSIAVVEQLLGARPQVISEKSGAVRVELG